MGRTGAGAGRPPRPSQTRRLSLTARGCRASAQGGPSAPTRCGQGPQRAGMSHRGTVGVVGCTSARGRAPRALGMAAPRRTRSRQRPRQHHGSARTSLKHSRATGGRREGDTRHTTTRSLAIQKDTTIQRRREAPTSTAAARAGATSSATGTTKKKKNTDVHQPTQTARQSSPPRRRRACALRPAPNHHTQTPPRHTGVVLVGRREIGRDTPIRRCSHRPGSAQCNA